MLRGHAMVKGKEDGYGVRIESSEPLNNKKEVRMKASFTAEAALVFPFILLIVFTVIYVVFYLYDEVYTVSGVHIAAERAAYGQFAALSGGILFREGEMRIEEKSGRVKIQAALKRKGPAEVLRLSGFSSVMKYEAFRRRTDPAELTRISQVLWNAGKSAAEKLREALKDGA